MIWESAFEEKKKQSGWKFNPVLGLNYQPSNNWALVGWRTPQPVSKLCDGALWRWGGKRNENLQLRLWNLNICIEKIDVKCWLVETTLVMTSVPSFTWFSMFVYIHTCFRFALIGGNLTAQSTWCHRGILRQNSSSRDMVASSLSFSCPAPSVPQRACSQAKNPSASRGC